MNRQTEPHTTAIDLARDLARAEGLVDSEPGRAATIAESVASASRRRADDPMLVDALLIAGRAAIRNYDFSAAARHLDEGLAHAVTALDEGSTGAEIVVALFLAQAERAFHMTVYSEASHYALKAQEYAREGVDKACWGEVMTWIGASFVQMNRYDRGLEHLREALDLFLESGQPWRAGRALNYLAVVYEELGDYETAFDLYRQAAYVLEIARDRHMLALVLSNWGDAYTNIGHHERAIETLQRALAIADRMGDHSAAAWCLYTMARSREALGETRIARELNEVSVSRAEQGLGKRHLAESLTGLGAHLARHEEHEKGLDLLKRALDIAESIRVDRETFKVHLALSTAYEAVGDHHSALTHFKAFHSIRARVYDDIAEGRLSSLFAVRSN